MGFTLPPFKAERNRGARCPCSKRKETGAVCRIMPPPIQNRKKRGAVCRITLPPFETGRNRGQRVGITLPSFETEMNRGITLPPFETEINEGQRVGFTLPPFSMERNRGRREYDRPRSKQKETGGGMNMTAPIQDGKKQGQRVEFTHPRLNKNSPPPNGGEDS